MSRASPKLQQQIASLEPTLAPNGQPMTLSMIREVFDADRAGWDFVTCAMEADPEKRPPAEQLLQHPWLG